MKRRGVAFAAGLVFALGLGAGGMTDPAKVQGFLDLTGDWKPGLAFVMGGALGTFALLRAVILRKRARPVFAAAFPVPLRSQVDPPLLLGAALFGVGWGLAGFCPGPAVVSLGSGSGSSLWFFASMLAGMLLFRGLEALRPAPEGEGRSRGASVVGLTGTE